jgi:hypothetical protein
MGGQGLREWTGRADFQLDPLRLIFADGDLVMVLNVANYGLVGLVAGNPH